MKHKKLRELCNFQYWLGSNYETLPTSSVEMTERAIKYTKQQGKKLPMHLVSGCYDELDMKAAFEAGVYYERSCEHYSKQPKVSMVGHLVSNPTPDFSEFMHNYNNR